MADEEKALEETPEGGEPEVEAPTEGDEEAAAAEEEVAVNIEPEVEAPTEGDEVAAAAAAEEEEAVNIDPGDEMAAVAEGEVAGEIDALPDEEEEKNSKADSLPDEEVEEKEIIKDEPTVEKRPSKVPERLPSKVPEILPSKVSENLASKVPERLPSKVSENLSSKVPEKLPLKKEEMKPLFDSKGSLLETESYIKGKLQEFKEKRAAVAVLIGKLQAKVKAYKEEENPTDEDIANLKKYHAEFLGKLGEYEEMTRNVEQLMGMTEVPSSQIDIAAVQSKPPTKPEPPKPLGNIEEKLPKLIVCGTDMGDSVPRIIVCEPLNRSHTQPFYPPDKPDSPVRPVIPDKGIPPECEGLVKERLREAHEAQQKLAKENVEINQMRQQLQQELYAKQDMLENMKRQMMLAESEKYRIQTENAELQRRLMAFGQRPGEGKICKRELYMKCRGKSPEEGSPFCGVDNTQDLEQELANMNEDVQNICCQLEIMEMDKISLGYSTSPRKPICKRMLPQKTTQTDGDKERDICFETDRDPKYKDLREQYHRLHNDFKNKVTEVASLRVDLEKTRTELDEVTLLHHALEAMHQKELDNNSVLSLEKHQIQSMKDQILDLEQAASFAKQMYNCSQEEMEEMRALIEDQATQLDEYRNKYMRTLQIAEELKKENEFKERECADQIAVEIQRVKLEMQEQLEELRPIKDLLIITQQKLKETEQMHTIALETIADLSQKLETALQQVEVAHAQIENAGTGGEMIENLQHSLEMAEKRLTELERENECLKETIRRLEQLLAEQNHRLEEKSHEVLVLLSQLETLREESARQVARLKERNGMVRKCLQAQIAEMEGEVAMCRAESSCANRERDEIRSKLQLEICFLSENFRDSQNRILQLQQHVSYLNASHPTAFIDLCN